MPRILPTRSLHHSDANIGALQASFRCGEPTVGYRRAVGDCVEETCPAR